MFHFLHSVVKASCAENSSSAQSATPGVCLFVSKNIEGDRLAAMLLALGKDTPLMAARIASASSFLTACFLPRLASGYAAIAGSKASQKFAR